MIMGDPIYVNGRKLYPFNSNEELLKKLENFKGLLIAMGAEKLLSEDKDLISIINNNLTYCDGYGAVYALKRKGVTSKKIPGAYFWLDIVNRFSLSKSFYILGSKQETLEKTISKLKSEYPSINIVGSNNGYFKDDKLVISDICKKQPDIVFVAMGSPKQEFFMNKSYENYNAIYMGLGGSFDLYTGNAKPVPKLWLKYIKWEGLYRNLMDIRNMKRLKRQVVVVKYIKAIFEGKI